MYEVSGALYTFYQPVGLIRIHKSYFTDDFGNSSISKMAVVIFSSNEIQCPKVANLSYHFLCLIDKHTMQWQGTLGLEYK